MYYDNKPMIHRFEQVRCFSQEELLRRLFEVRKVMRQREVDVLLLLEADWEGYSQWLIGEKNTYMVVVPMEGNIRAVFGERLLENGGSAKHLVPQAWYRFGEAVEPAGPHIDFADAFDGFGLKKVMELGDWPRIGFVHQETMRADLKLYLEQVFPGAEYVDITLDIDPVKATKSAEEMVYIKNAVALHEKLIGALPSIIRPGRTIGQVNTETRYLAHQMGSGGAVCLCFAIQSGDDREGPLGHRSGLAPYPERKLRWGDRIFMLLEANGLGGHFTALGRNFCLGEPTADAVKYWELALKMQDFAAKNLKPGVSVKEIFDANVAYIESLGYKTNRQNYLHSLGYVFGEKPYLHDVSETIPLRENMVYLNHPHVRINRGADTGKVIYDDLYAIDTYLVTKTGGVRQNRIPRELIVIE